MHTYNDLRILQSYPLDIKLALTERRIRGWVDYFGIDNVYVSFSGGKDSTVLLHIARRIFPNIEAVFCDTGLEYPEVRQFAKTFDNVRTIRPKLRFDEVIKLYGYPFIGKEVAERVYNTHKFLSGKGGHFQHYYQLTGDLPSQSTSDTGARGFFSSRYDFSKWKPLLDMDFNISHLCCNEMKKKPLNHLGKKAIVATMTEESMLRRTAWLKTGCNAFKKGISKPMSFWTEQDIFQYIKLHDLPIASVYGDIVYQTKNGLLYNTCLCDCAGKLCTTGCHRTGCVYCAFGAQNTTRFTDLKRTHLRQYDYCMGGGAYDIDGLWKPTKDGLGMAHCIDQINRVFGKELIRY